VQWARSQGLKASGRTPASTWKTIRAFKLDFRSHSDFQHRADVILTSGVRVGIRALAALRMYDMQKYPDGPAQECFYEAT
jgi:hypothetical protein